MRRLQVTTHNKRPLMVGMVASASISLSKLFSESVLHFQRALFNKQLPFNRVLGVLDSFIHSTLVGFHSALAEDCRNEIERNYRRRELCELCVRASLKAFKHSPLELRSFV